MKKEKEPKNKKLTNDEKVANVKKRKILLGFIFFFGIATILLSIVSLIFKVTPLFAIIAFLIEVMISKYRDRLDPKVVKSDSKNQE